MALKAVVDSLDGLSDEVKAFYTEEDGKHVLAVEGVDLHPQVGTLKRAYERNKADLVAAKDAAKKASDDLAAALKGKPDEAAVQKLRADLEKERDDALRRATDLEGRLTATTRDRALSEALSVAGVTNPAFVRAAQALLAGSVKMDGDKPVVETDMGPVPLSEHVKRWTAGEGAAFVAPPSGGGAKGQGGAPQGKTMTRAQFDALEPVARAKVMAEQTTLTD